MNTFLKIAVAFIFGGLSTLYGAFVFHTLWVWYITPTGFTVPSYHTLIGAAVMSSVMFTPITTLLATRAEGSRGNIPSKYGVAWMICYNVIGYSVALLLGYIWHLILA